MRALRPRTSRWSSTRRELIDDNKIRAARHGTDANLIDFRAGQQVEASDMARELIELLAPDADELGCRAELDGVESILANGHRRPAPAGDRGSAPAISRR